MVKISVIIPVYNVAEYIEECIQSVLDQSFRDFEIIVVDDCGKDNSIERASALLEAKANGIPYQILHHEKNRGLSAGRNTGMEVAQGDYVYFLDSDDYITLDCLSKLYDTAVETNAEITVGDYYTVGGDAKWLSHIQCGEQIIDNPLEAYLSGQYFVMVWNKLCKKEFLTNNQISFIEGLVHEDEPWTFEVACKAKKMAIVHDCTYVYRVREGSLQTGKDYTKHFKAYLTILNTIAKTIKENQANAFGWYERRKALYYTQTLDKGTPEQVKEMYGVIHDTLPQPKWTKTNCHYYFPKCIGIVLYKKFHKYFLC